MLAPLIIAGLLAYLLNPLVNYLSRRTRLSRKMSVNIVFLVMLAILIIIPATLIPRLLGQAQTLVEQVRQGVLEAEQLLAEPLVVGGYILTLDQVLDNVAISLSEEATSAAGSAVSFILGATSSLALALVTLVSTYYLLRDSHRLIDWIVEQAPPGYEVHCRYLIREINVVWSAFLRGQLLLMVLVALLTWLGALAVGLPGALTLGILAGVLDVVPSLGPTLASVPALLVAVFQGSTFLPVSNGWFALVVAAVYIVVQQIENIWLRPRIMSHSLHLHPAVVFVGVLSALVLVGVLGALIIVPLISTAGVLGRYLRAMLIDHDPYPARGELLPTSAPADPTPQPAEEPTPTASPGV